MSRSGIYDEEYGFIPDADEPQTYLCDSCSLFPCDDSGVKMERRCFAYSPIPKPQTNADRIRAMTDEELSAFLGSIVHDYGQGTAEIEGVGYVIDDWLDWLREEATP